MKSVGICRKQIEKTSSMLLEAVSQTVAILEQCSPHSRELEAVREQYSVDQNIGFNIFASISDQYKKENLHSDILTLLLDPATETIGTRHNARVLIELSEKSLGRSLNLNLNEGLSVERETGRIDVLLSGRAGKDGKRFGVIIENKINNAPDQPDQLPRYLRDAERKGITVESIIYLPLA